MGRPLCYYSRKRWERWHSHCSAGLRATEPTVLGWICNLGSSAVTCGWKLLAAEKGSSDNFAGVKLWKISWKSKNAVEIWRGSRGGMKSKSDGPSNEIQTKNEVIWKSAGNKNWNIRVLELAYRLGRSMCMQWIHYIKSNFSTDGHLNRSIHWKKGQK